MRAWKGILSRTGAPQYPTLIEPLDGYLFGCHKGELLVVGGRPSMGKTALTILMAHGLSTHSVVLYYSLEMSREQIIEREIARLARIDNQELRGGDKALGGRSDVVKGVALEYDECRLYVVDDSGYYVQQIINHVDALRPAFVFVDYIQLMPCLPGVKRHEMIAEILQGLKAVSKTLSCGIVVVSQINREGQLKSSGSLEEVADAVIEVKWTGRYNMDTPNDYEVIVSKQRHGPCGILRMKYFPEYYSFSER